MKTIKVYYKPGDRVYIKDIEIHGTVESVQIGWTCATLYSVSYWDNCERRSAWVMAAELEDAKK